MRRLLRFCLVALLTLLPAMAQAQDGLYDRPVLMLDPGMHTASIRRADVDASGRYAVTGSGDKTVKIRDARSGDLLDTVALPRGPGNVGRVDAVAIDPAGETIAAGGWTRYSHKDRQEQIYLIDRESGAIRQRLGGLPNVVAHLAFSPDGRFLAATLWGANGIRVYDRLTDWGEVGRDSAYGGSSYGAAFAKDGRLATTSLDGQLRLYAPGRFDAPLRSGGTGGRPFGVSFSPDGTRIAVGFADAPRVALYDGATLNPLPTPDLAGIGNGSLSFVAFVGDGALLAGGQYHDGETSPGLHWAHGGAGPHSQWRAGENAVRSLRPISGGDLLVAAADPLLARLGPEGAPRWRAGRPFADFRDQDRTLSVSQDGSEIGFGYAYGGSDPARFSLARLALRHGAHDDLSPPKQDGLAISGWKNTRNPSLNGSPLPLEQFERSRSLAIHPDGARFVLGTEWFLRAFDAQGDQLWQRPAPGAVWAVTISGDGRFVIAAHGDGTIRWHRMEDGAELLALFVFAGEHRGDWVAWTPEGYYTYEGDAARDALRWVVNRGWDSAAEIVPVTEIKGLEAPEAIRAALQPGGVMAALGRRYDRQVLENAERALNTALRTRLHFVGIGVSRYRDTRISLDYAAKDVEDIATILRARDERLYEVLPPRTITDDRVTNRSIRTELNDLYDRLSSTADDVVVILYSGHAAPSRGRTYLLPHDVDRTDIANTGFDLDYLKTLIAHLGTKPKTKIVVLLDACHSGGFIGKSIGALDVTEVSRALQHAGNSVMVLASSRHEQLSFEQAELSNGAFTKAVLESLSGPVADRSGDGWLTLQEMFDYVHGRVVSLTDGKQTPQMGSLTESHLTERLFRIGG